MTTDTFNALIRDCTIDLLRHAGEPQRTALLAACAYCLAPDERNFEAAVCAVAERAGIGAAPALECFQDAVDSIRDELLVREHYRGRG